jgi:enoyl-CoA hydratase
MLADRASAYVQWDLPLRLALHQEWERGKQCLGDALDGATRFSAGDGRHGKF